MNLGSASVIRGNARSLPLADNSVDLVVTSPPYFALRSYQDGGEHYAGQIGDEPTPAAFVASLLEVTAECVRVLKPSGSLWVNLGDKYAGGGGDWAGHEGSGDLYQRQGQKGNGGRTFGLQRKSLIGIPWRYALACIDDLGLILRAEVIWSKPNGLPESVTDRVRRSHEQWFHFTLSPRYFSAVDEIRETYLAPNATRTMGNVDPSRGDHGKPLARLDARDQMNPLGKLPGSVWTADAESGDSLIRSVLSATAAGALTIEEGERILWTGKTNSGARSTSPSPAAGDGSDGPTTADTARCTPPAEASSGRIESSTSSTAAPSLMGSPSTTSAAIPGASGPATLSPSPSQRTFDAPTPNGPHASAGTTSQTPTSRSRATAASIDAAGSATASDSVWVVPTEPLRVPERLGVDHFAAFPTEFPKRIIAGWSPAGVCVACGEGRRPVTRVENVPLHVQGNRGAGKLDQHFNNRLTETRTVSRSEATITGYACACPHPTADTQPAVILDPFGGTGTTALVAKALGRHGISVDMSADYCRLATWRTNDRNQLARVLDLPKQDTQPDDQLSMF